MKIKWLIIPFLLLLGFMLVDKVVYENSKTSVTVANNQR